MASPLRPDETSADVPEVAPRDTIAAAAVVELPDLRIGRYRLLQKLGEGGMGTVYLAEQEEPVRRSVALKVVRAGMDSAQIVARFEAERQALAMMDHPNIARVLDAGATLTGLPFLVMELVRGVPITEYCDQRRLTPRERLQLFIPVCQAIQHAHLKGIIHRDMKPSNVLVTLSDPGAPGVPKVIDFGLAKATDQRLTERPLFTQADTVLGTLEYMSPEQAAPSALGIDTRTDIYSLGALLFELLTGLSPLQTRLQGATMNEVFQMIAEVEPLPPSAQLASSDQLPAAAAARRTEPARLKKLLHGDLDWIVMKCLEKDRTRRYETANALARDIERYLADEPVEASPPSAGYRLRRFARKHRKALAAAGGFVLLLIAGVIVSSWLALRAMRAESAERDSARQMQIERDRTRLALTRQVADRLDGDLRRLATAAQVLATTLAERADWQEGQLEAWLRAELAKDEEMFALNVGFEPRRFDKDREDYCLYIYRGAKDIEKKHLLPPTYLPLYREWPWYTKPRAERRGSWSEPYVDTGGGDIPMVTYTAPIVRRGEFIGVVSLDLSVAYFEGLRSGLKDLSLGETSYGFVISHEGLIISHPHADYDFARLVAANRSPRRIMELPGAGDSFVALARSMLKDAAGSGTAIDPATGKEATFLFARAPSAGWTFVAVIEEASEAR